MKVYNKLVRDNIPQIIKSSGKACNYYVLSDGEFIECLNAKLQEEVAEYLQSGEVEELADILEVLRALVVAKGCTVDALEAIRAQKAAKNGAFNQKLLLEWVDGD